eukprot:TRINITY_DN687_c0_g1_i1.p1 TRINITY_DN687_c0_g1~~TRINITY_DN687_c0_g1_i1.p1  ORF type:complete len:456 (-),score=129.58 TRINITY_DN687_c0_g1_i1:31-1398(-)
MEDLPTVPSSMESYVFKKAMSEAKEMKISTVPTPTPTADEILVEVVTIGVNFADIVMRKGNYNDAPSYPYAPGYEICGTVVRVGANVTKFSLGDHVIALTDFYGYSQYVVSPEEGSVLLPPSLSFAQGAAIPVSFLTAYYCLHYTGPVFKGQKILIHGGAGGLGQALIQLCKIEGLEIFTTAGSDSKLKMLKDEYGVDHTINYRSTEFDKEILKITDGKPMIDIVIDSVGGSYFKRGIELLRPTGRMVGVGASSLNKKGLGSVFSFVSNVASMITLNAVNLLLKSKSFVGVNLYQVSMARREIITDMLNKLVKMFDEGKLLTVVSNEYEWTEGVQAHQDLESRKTTGKLIIRISPDPSRDSDAAHASKKEKKLKSTAKKKSKRVKEPKEVEVKEEKGVVELTDETAPTTKGSNKGKGKAKEKSVKQKKMKKEKEVAEEVVVDKEQDVELEAEEVI